MPGEIVILQPAPNKSADQSGRKTEGTGIPESVATFIVKPLTELSQSLSTSIARLAQNMERPISTLRDAGKISEVELEIKVSLSAEGDFVVVKGESAGEISIKITW